MEENSGELMTKEIKKVKWQGHIQWIDPTISSSMDEIAYELAPNFVYISSKLTKRLDSPTEALKAIEEIRNTHAILDHQIVSMKIWRIPKRFPKARLRLRKKRG